MKKKKADKIDFDEKTKANVLELKRAIDACQLQLRTICQTVLYMNNENPDEWTLAPNLSGVVRLPKPEEIKDQKDKT